MLLRIHRAQPLEISYTHIVAISQQNAKIIVKKYGNLAPVQLIEFIPMKIDVTQDPPGAAT